MKQLTNISVVESIISHCGLVATESPSPEYPAAVTVSYRNNPDGTIRWLFPSGGRVHFTKKREALTAIDKICVLTGLAGLVADGRLTLYADPQTALYIRNNWSALE